MTQNTNSAPSTPPSTTPAGMFSHRVVCGTDIASFFIYHPDDLKHRLTSPQGWTWYHFACGPEFLAGRLVGFTTGSDGGYGFRITNEPLSDREKQWLAGSWDFRYHVKHGRVYLDGGYALPCTNHFDDSADHPEQWIKVPNGDYRVRVNAIEWYSEPGALDDNGQATENALTNYVIQFIPVDDLESIESSLTPPQLETSRDSKPTVATPQSEYDTFDERDFNVEGSYFVLVHRDEAPVPGFHLKLRVSDEFYQAVWGREGSTRLPDRIKELVIASSDKTPCLGAVVIPTGASKTNDEQWKMSFHVKRLVTITSLTPTKPWPTGKVQAVERPASTVALDRVTALKQAFAVYSKSNQAYREKVKYPDFEADHIATVESVAGLGRVLIHYVQMPAATRLELLPLSDADRVERLIKVIEESTPR